MIAERNMAIIIKLLKELRQIKIIMKNKEKFQLRYAN